MTTTFVSILKSYFYMTSIYKVSEIDTSHIHTLLYIALLNSISFLYGVKCRRYYKMSLGNNIISIDYIIMVNKNL